MFFSISLSITTLVGGGGGGRRFFLLVLVLCSSVVSSPPNSSSSSSFLSLLLVLIVNGDNTPNKSTAISFFVAALVLLVENNSNATNKTGTMTRWQYWKEVFIYMMPILIGALFFLAIGWQFGIQHDRSFYLNLLQRPGHPHLEAGAVYGMVMVATGASYSSLIVTLCDKKRIRKRTEGLSLTAIMACLVGSLYQALRDPGTISMIMGM